MEYCHSPGRDQYLGRRAYLFYRIFQITGGEKAERGKENIRPGHESPEKTYGSRPGIDHG